MNIEGGDQNTNSYVTTETIDKLEEYLRSKVDNDSSTHFDVGNLSNFQISTIEKNQNTFKIVQYLRAKFKP